MTSHLLTLYTRTPLHVGCGTSVDVVDLPIMRERITNFPVIPSTSLKGVLREASRQHFGETNAAITRNLFGEDRKLKDDDGNGGSVTAFAGCLQIMEAKLLAFPVRSLGGCFAWLTCPAALHRFQRDTESTFNIPEVKKDEVIVASDSELIISGQKVVLEEYSLTSNSADPAHAEVAKALGALLDDPLWTSKLPRRLAVLHDEDFQHFVTTCTEVVARIAIEADTRVVKKGGLFNQENVPCEALFYSTLRVLQPRRKDESDPANQLTELLRANPTLQIGGDETTGHGFCAARIVPMDACSHDHFRKDPRLTVTFHQDPSLPVSDIQTLR